MNRLVSATGSYGSLGYAYDLVGNRQSQTIGGTAQAYAYTAGTNRLASISQGATLLHQFADSPTGNVTQDNRAGTVFNFGYGQADRLTTVQQGSSPVATYTYDRLRPASSEGADRAAGKHHALPVRPRRPPDGGQRHFLREPEFPGRLHLSRRPAGRARPPRLRPSVLPRRPADDAATRHRQCQRHPVDRRLQPFGTVAVTGSITQNLRLPGQYADAETGWSNNGFRTYAPDLGRYIQSDPIGLQGGINDYRYALNNPVTYADPGGTGPLGFLVGFIVGASAGSESGPGAILAGLELGSLVSALEDALSGNKNPENCPPLPERLLGEPPNDPRGKRVNSGPLTPENGGTGDAETDFGTLTGIPLPPKVAIILLALRWGQMVSACGRQRGPLDRG
jgi:RHS repeat-associated protein